MLAKSAGESELRWRRGVGSEGDNKLNSFKLGWIAITRVRVGEKALAKLTIYTHQNTNHFLWVSGAINGQAWLMFRAIGVKTRGQGGPILNLPLRLINIHTCTADRHDCITFGPLKMELLPTPIRTMLTKWYLELSQKQSQASIFREGHTPPAYACMLYTLSLLWPHHALENQQRKQASHNRQHLYM